jgi:hypothetical protein
MSSNNYYTYNGNDSIDSIIRNAEIDIAEFERKIRMKKNNSYCSSYVSCFSSDGVPSMSFQDSGYRSIGYALNSN